MVVGGGALPSVRVEVNPTQLNSYGLTLSNVQSTLSTRIPILRAARSANGADSSDILVNGQILTPPNTLR